MQLQQQYRAKQAIGIVLALVLAGVALASATDWLLNEWQIQTYCKLANGRDGYVRDGVIHCTYDQPVARWP